MSYPREKSHGGGEGSDEEPVAEVKTEVKH